MINETQIVMEYLNGENINQKTLYRTCFLLAKWLKESGIDNKKEIRDRIFSWACKYGITISLNLNDCIDRAVANKRRLTSDNAIRVSAEDVKRIKETFDNKNVRLVALGILCYAKQFADINNEFDLPVYAFADWVGIDPANLIKRYMREVMDYGYVTKVSSSTNAWRAVARSKSTRYKINVSILNYGDSVIEGNDIRGLFSKIF